MVAVFYGTVDGVDCDTPTQMTRRERERERERNTRAHVNDVTTDTSPDNKRVTAGRKRHEPSGTTVWIGIVGIHGVNAVEDKLCLLATVAATRSCLRRIHIANEEAKAVIGFTTYPPH